MQSYSVLLIEFFSLEEVLVYCINIILTWPKYYDKAIENYIAKEKFKFLSILTTHPDGKTEFIPSIAGYECSVHTVQWHPKKALYEWKPLRSISHAPNALKTVFYLAEFVFFFSEPRKTVITMSPNLRI